AAAAAHLEQCRECQELAANLRGVSQDLSAWQVEPSELEINPRITVALEDHVRDQEATVKKRRPSWRLRAGVWRWVVRGLATAVVLAIVVALSIPNLMRSKMAAYRAAEASRAQMQQTASYYSNDSQAGLVVGTETVGVREHKTQNVESKPRGLILPTGPMVIRTADLLLISTDFDHARTKLEDILKRHHGYLGQLSASGSTESARTLEATLRIPADQLDAAISELKTLGRVDNESQKGEEVSQQYVDLQARLANARETEQTLLDILRHRTGRLSDVLQVEQEIASVREEIERMEAEKKNMEKQVAFSTVNMKVTEDFKQHVHVVPDSTSTRVRNAAVDGYETMVAGLINVLLFFAAAGPSILLWGVVLFFPARWIWKKWRQRNQI
ncbi:MAG TPA: DUF4349 domain-containing protein, partial [Candidatus Angelobacter sp.]